MGVFGQTSRQYQRKRYVGPKRAFNRMRYYANLNKKRKMGKKTYRTPGQARPMSDLRLTYKGENSVTKLASKFILKLSRFTTAIVPVAATNES